MAFKSLIGATCTCLAVASFSADAALVSRLGGLAFYDDVANLTWLADANYAQTSGYASNGRLFYADAITWAADLSVGGNDNWRLPDTKQPDAGCSGISVRGSFGFGCTGSEMGNLYYNTLGNTALLGINDDAYNTGPFINIQNRYWSATEVASRLGIEAWRFDMNVGAQSNGGFTIGQSVWAVQTGDVGQSTSAVPVPAAAWLFGSGLIGLIGVARRKKA